MDQRPMPSSSSHPTLCRNGCGFFGNTATEGMCSKCHSDYGGRKAQQETRTSSSPAAASRLRPSVSNTVAMTRDRRVLSEEVLGTVGRTSEVAATPLSALPAPPTPSSPPLNKTPKKNRCHMCRKKVGLTGFACRCGHQYCSLHRYADTHQCTFDYKTSGREELEKKHPKVIAAKIDKL